jgi:hypothetical protein
MQKQLQAAQQQHEAGDAAGVSANAHGPWTEEPFLGGGGSSSSSRRLLQAGWAQLRPAANTSRCLGPPGGSYAAGGQLLLEDCTGEGDGAFNAVCSGAAGTALYLIVSPVPLAHPPSSLAPCPLLNPVQQKQQ